MSIQAIVAACESLGDTGEFGHVQRLLKTDRPGLFRRAAAPLPALLHALKRDFAGLAEPNGLDLVVAPDDALHVRVRDYQFDYPTPYFLGEITADTLLAEQAETLGRLVDQLRSDLATADKLFVRKAGADETGDDAAALLRALRRHGPVTLLWVTRDANHARVGSVEVLREGLLHGRVNRYAPPDDPGNVSPSWLDVCRNAHALWRAACPCGTRIDRAGAGLRNLLRGTDQFAGQGWRNPAGAATALLPDHAGPRPGAAVAEHVLAADGDGVRAAHGYYLPSGMTEAEIYVGSLQLWLPADFAGAEVDVVFEGYPTLRLRPADLARREAWQHIWVAAVIPAGHINAHLALQARGAGALRLRSSCWQLERGGFPTGYMPGEA